MDVRQIVVVTVVVVVPPCMNDWRLTKLFPPGGGFGAAVVWTWVVWPTRGAAPTVGPTLAGALARAVAAAHDLDRAAAPALRAPTG